MTMRFLGVFSELAGARLDRFGKSFQVADADAVEFVTGPDAKLPALPAAEFDKIGFTSQELERYQWPSTHADAPQSFLDKKRAALARLAEIRNQPKPAEVKP